MSHITRRQFAVAAGAGLVAAGAPRVAAGTNRSKASRAMRLSLAAYSFNRMLPRRGTPEQIAKAKMKLEDFVDYCAEQQLDGTELTGYYFPKEVTPEYLASLKQRTFRAGLEISGTAIGNDFDQLYPGFVDTDNAAVILAHVITGLDPMYPTSVIPYQCKETA